MASASRTLAEDLSDFWERVCRNKTLRAVDVLEGSALKEMGKALGFWCYSLDNVFEAPVHADFEKLINLAFDPAAGGGIGKPREEVELGGKQKVSVQGAECLQAPLCLR